MPLTSAIIHPRLTQELRPSFLRQRCAIWTLPTPPLKDSLGQIKQDWPADYSVLTGHEDIPCNLAADDGDSAAFVERRQQDQTFVSRPLYCQLDGYYPAITEQMRAVVDTVAYDVKGVTPSSTGRLTRLSLERIE